MTLRSNQDVENEANNVEIELTEPVSLTFSLKYLVNFCKAQPLSQRVKVCLSNEVPLLVEYGLAGTSYLRFYLAPKVRATPTPPYQDFVVLIAIYRLVTRSKEHFWTGAFCTMITRYIPYGRHPTRLHSGTEWKIDTECCLR